MNVIETERLIIRAFTLDDVVDIHREVYSDPTVCLRYCGKTRTIEEVTDDLACQSHLAKADYHWARRAVALKESHELIGLVRLEPFHNRWYRWEEEPDPRYNELEVELSFAFGQRSWGKGYAYEASKAMVHHAFAELKLRRLVGGAHAENPRSLNLQRRLGYKVFPALEIAGSDGGFVTVLDNNIL